MSQCGVEFEVREADEADVPMVQECYLRSWRAAYDGFLDQPVLEQEARRRADFDWCRGIRAQTAVVLVAVTPDHRLLGVMQADEDLLVPPDLPQVTMLYVEPSVWGCGVAAELLSGGVRWIAARGHPAARLRVVEEHRRARRFYEREGWQLDPDTEPVSNGFFRLLSYRRCLGSREP